jgi:signal transduction histidine kinase
LTSQSDKKKDAQPRRNVDILVTIGGIALILAAASYFYITYVADLVRSQAVSDLQFTAEVKADDLASIAEEQIESVRTNLVLISTTHSVQGGDVDTALNSTLFSTAQDLTKDLTFSYFWLDKDGKLLWTTSFSNATLFQQYAGSDSSQRSFYKVPMQTHRFFVSEVILGSDGVRRIIFANPILDNKDSSFKGIIAASSNLNEIGNLFEGRLEGTRNNPIFLGIDGTILYSQDESKIGLNVFGEEFRSSLPDSTRSDVMSFIRKSLDDSTSGSLISGSGNFENLAADGQSATIAYHSVRVAESPIAAVFLIVPQTFATNTFLQLQNLSILAVVIIAGIGAVAFALAALVVKWNRGLQSLVSKRTLELEARTKELELANRNLDGANRGLSKAYEDLKVHEKLQREFVNIAAHELRTPVQPLLGAAEIIDSQFGDKEKVEVSKPEIEMIIRNAKRLERLSSDILAMSRLESGAFKLNKETFSLSYIIADAIKDAKTRSGIGLERVAIEHHADDIFVNADREKISQVVSNLLTNAIKFTQGGKITVTTKKDPSGNTATVTVKDTGAGIDAEVLPKLFEKFVTKSERGTGIGLYLSKKLVEAHGGTISGQNNVDGPGATFSFTLPLT